jgi:hypothetical protein
MYRACEIEKPKRSINEPLKGARVSIYANCGTGELREMVCRLSVPDIQSSLAR